MENSLFNKVFDELTNKSPMNDAEIARRLGVNRSTIARWKSGEQSPPLSKIPLIAELFDVHPMVFVGGSEYISTYDERTIINKYKALDDKGKHTVRTVLNVEYDRCTKPHLEVVAAHNDDYSEEQQQLIREDIDELMKLHTKRKK